MSQVLRHGHPREDVPALGHVADAAGRSAGAPGCRRSAGRRSGSRPAAGRSMPDTVFWVVVLPAPFAPSSATISPSSTWKRDALERRGWRRSGPRCRRPRAASVAVPSALIGAHPCARRACPRRRGVDACSSGWSSVQLLPPPPRRCRGRPRPRPGRAGSAPGVPSAIFSPKFSTTMRWATDMTSFMSCSISSTLTPRSALIRGSARRARASRPGWCRRPARRAACTPGLVPSARAISSRRCSP